MNLIKNCLTARVLAEQGECKMAFIEGLKQVLPILILLAAIAVVLMRLPKVDVGHSPAFKRRRVMNWLPLGLTYSFLYMGRYNLTVSKNALGTLMSNGDFGTIFFWGTLVYGTAFIINGPLTDRLGGRAAILLGAAGSAVMNLAMGVLVWSGYTSHLVLWFSILYAANMYFQSFGAVAIVKVNASWFHLRERGTFGGIFGILISLGLYFAFDWSELIARNAPVYWVFFAPVILLLGFMCIDYFWVKDSPGDAGFQNFETADATWELKGEKESAAGGPTAWEVAKRMLSSPVIITIAMIEFCSGFLRNAIMHWYIIYAKQTGIMGTFVPSNWGLLLCCAGILGGVFAGVISDKVFNSRRGPVSAVLYAGMLMGGVALSFLLGTIALGWTVVFLSLCIIGVHGMLSGTASMDFGGKKNVGVAVGLIDGMVYLGTSVQSLLYANVLPSGDLAKDPANWTAWPAAMAPVAALGLWLCVRLWNATPASARSPQPKSTKIPVALTGQPNGAK
jgi:MFS transporter, OPA family, glycerol-3-phosphate transporter